MYERILVALDGSKVAEAVLPTVEELAEKFGSTIVLLQVAPRLSSSSVAPSPALDPTMTHRVELEAAQSYLSAVAQQLQWRGRPTRTALLEGNATEEILGYLRTERVDLL